MRQSHIIFNVIGIASAAIFGMSACGQILGGYPQSTILWTGIVILLVGGGSLANLFDRGLSFWPTIIVISGYCISMFLVPFAIWGIVLLVLDRKRRERRWRSYGKRH